MKFSAFRQKDWAVMCVFGVSVVAFGLFSLAANAQEAPRRTIRPESQAKSVEEGGIATDCGWLGVSIEAVSESMAARLGTQALGVMVGGVVESSPADTAGIQANDLIVAMNGEDVVSDVGLAVDLIKSRKPGETIDLEILRSGQWMTLKATLGSREHFEEQIKSSGKHLMKAPDGRLIFEDIGADEDLRDFSNNSRQFVPKAGARSNQVFVENGQKTIIMYVEKDGATVSIEQQDGGSITVRRSDDGGKETVTTYDHKDALKEAEQDAYELYSQAGQSVIVHVDGDDVGDGDVDSTATDKGTVEIQRFLQVDPLHKLHFQVGNSSGNNYYVYLNTSPVNQLDPSELIFVGGGVLTVHAILTSAQLPAQ